jgi:hypothetical protein
MGGSIRPSLIPTSKRLTSAPLFVSRLIIYEPRRQLPAPVLNLEPSVYESSIVGAQLLLLAPTMAFVALPARGA